MPVLSIPVLLLAKTLKPGFLDRLKPVSELETPLFSQPQNLIPEKPYISNQALTLIFQ